MISDPELVAPWGAARSADDWWVDPVHGDDSADGGERTTALRSIAEAWRRIPVEVSGSAQRIRLCAGMHAGSDGFVRLTGRRGSATAPIVVAAADEPTSVRLAPIDARDCGHLCLIGLSISAPANAAINASDDNLVHLERCHHVLLRGVAATGVDGPQGLPRLAFKANQCSHLYVEDCAFTGSYAYAFAYVAVQHGHIVRSRFGDCGAAGICLKGGSAYHLVADNRISGCRNMGITIGEGTGFPYLVEPWLRYEAYACTVIANTIRDSGGGLCVSGGYDILVAHNTCWRVGSSRDTIVIAMGGRGWVGDAWARPVCDRYHRAGGWCSPTAPETFIPCRRLSFVNNLIVNPAGYESAFAHIGLSGPVPSAADSNVPDPARMEDVVIAGNLIWNGGPDKPVLDDVEHCYGLAARPTADAADLRARNRINDLEPRLVDADRGDLRIVAGSPAAQLRPVGIPAWVPDPSHADTALDDPHRGAAVARLRTFAQVGAVQR